MEGRPSISRKYALKFLFPLNINPRGVRVDSYSPLLRRRPAQWSSIAMKPKLRIHRNQSQNKNWSRPIYPLDDDQLAGRMLPATSQELLRFQHMLLDTERLRFQHIVSECEVLSLRNGR